MLSQLGLRFFICAGLHSSYGHSYFMYSKACELCEIKLNPSVIFDVLEAYRIEGRFISLNAFKVVFNLCKEANLADEALSVLRKIPDFGLRPDTTLYNVVIRLFCDKGDMNMAESLVKEMGLVDLLPDLITYMVMINGFCNVGRSEKMERALELLTEMEKVGGDCSPNVVTYTSVIQKLCDKGRLKEALVIFDRMEACGCAPSRVMDQVEEAYKQIDRVVAGRSVTYSDCYSSLVVSLARGRKPEEAEKVLRMMLDSGVKPNSLACSIMLKKICLEGRVIDGFCLFHELEKME
ncbi:hypothetical protein ACE6H2_015290 [Prunus campanulata]